MRENIIVSSRGQITLPAGMRKKLGIKPGGVVIVEDRDGEVVLRPAAVVEVDVYGDTEIDRWQSEDRLSSSERKRILDKLGKR